VQRHQLYRVLIRVRLPIAGFQRGMGQERLQRQQVLILVLVAVLPGGGHQFLKVFDARLALFAFFLLIHDPQAGIFDHAIGQDMQGEIGSLFRQGVHQFDEALHGRSGAASQYPFI